jgi:hypothetical protein
MIIKFPQIFSALGSKINKAMTLVMPANYISSHCRMGHVTLLAERRAFKYCCKQ